MSDQTAKKNEIWQKLTFIIPSIFFFIPNFFYTMNAWNVRHRADDFCFSGTFREFGFFGGLEQFYLTISNRFSAFLLWSFSDLFGENAIRIFPMAAIVLTAISVYIIARSLAEKHLPKTKSFFKKSIFTCCTPIYIFLQPLLK